MTTPPEDYGELTDQLLVTRAGPGYDQIRGEALAELLAIGEPAHAALLARLDDQDTLADNVVRVLPLFELPESVPILEQYLLDGEDTTTVTAAHALAEHPDESALQALLNALAAERDQTVLSAVNGLADRGDATAIPSLQALAKHDNQPITVAAARAIAALITRPDVAG